MARLPVLLFLWQVAASLGASTAGGLPQQASELLPEALLKKWDTTPAGTMSRERLQSVPVGCLPHNHVLKEPVLLPATLLKLGALPTCGASVREANREGLRVLKEHLYQVQVEGSCEQGTTVGLHDAGWMSTVHGMIKPLSQALRTGTLIYSPLSYGWTRGECGARSVACMLRTFAPRCENSTMARPYVSDNLQQVVPVADVEMLHAMKDKYNSYPGADIMVSYDNSYHHHGESIIPEPYRPFGWFWYSSHLMEWAFQPDDALTDQFGDAMNASGLDVALQRGLVLGLHVRRGDACGGDAARTGRVCNTLKDYMVRVDEMRRDTGVKTIFLTTDSNDVLIETFQYPQYKWIFWGGSNENDQRLFAEHKTNNWDQILHDNIESQHTGQNEQGARMASVVALLLSQCDLFVGKFTSNFFRFSYELKASRVNSAVPYASLDAPWCMDYAMEAGHSRVMNDNGEIELRKFMC